MTQSNIRPAFHAGFFYPSDHNIIIDMIKKLEAHVKITTVKEKIFGAIIPHAGYIYSGYCALHVYKILQKLKIIKQIILIGPYHQDGSDDIIIPDYDSWETPFGDVSTNNDMLNSIIKQFKEKNLPYRFEKNDGEHSLEVQMPFIKYFLPDVKIIPMMCNNISLSKKISDVIASIIDNRDDTIFLASSDLSHYNPEKIAHDIDTQTIKHILAFQEKEIINDIIEREGMCGYVGILALAHMAKNLNLKADLLNYSNSFNGGKFLGLQKQQVKDSVVGYCSMIFYK